MNARLDWDPPAPVVAAVDVDDKRVVNGTADINQLAPFK